MNTTENVVEAKSKEPLTNDRPYAIEFLASTSDREGWIHEKSLCDLIDDLHQEGWTGRDVQHIDVEANVVYPRQDSEECLLSIPIRFWAHQVGDEMHLYPSHSLPRWELHEEATDSWDGEEAVVGLQ